MAADQAKYDIFVSYARLDNRPLPDTHPVGWVTALRDHILADQRCYSTEPLRIFFDASEIKDMDDWRQRILGGMRSSKILLVCLSPNYFKSEPCRWEWDEYQKRATHHLMGSDTIAVVYFVEVPGSGESENAERLGDLMRGNFTDLRPWFPAGSRMLQDAEVQRRLEALGLSLWERIDRARRASAVPGNIRRSNPFFVGRREELRRLHDQLGVGAIGVVTAVHGLGGQGKTELACHYANGFADCYPAGLWLVGAEGKRDLLALLGELAFVPQFGYAPSDAEKADARRLGQAVLEELRKRCSGSGTKAALIMLDNVSEPDLLSAAQLADLPHPAPWLRIMATTRLGPERLAMSRKQLATVPVDSLDEDDALTLIRDHQPGQRFPDSAEESAARELVSELGGFTLAVEQAAVFLGLNAPDQTPSGLLKRLRQDGLPSMDDLPKDADVARKMLHQNKQLAPILRLTLEPLAAEMPEVETALQFAAQLPPDCVPWPWLKDFIAGRHPKCRPSFWRDWLPKLKKLMTRRRPLPVDQPVSWAKIKRHLEGLRLLTCSDRPEIARMHRLLTAHFRKASSNAVTSELRTFLALRWNSIVQGLALPEKWELFALMFAVPNSAKEGTDLAGTLMKIPGRLPEAAILVEITHAVHQRLADSDRSNAEYTFNLSQSLERLGDLAKAQGKLPEARQFFADALNISKRLAKSNRGNADWQYSVSVSLEKLGDALVAQGSLGEAKQFFADSLDIRRQLGRQGPLLESLLKFADLALARDKPAEAEQLTVESQRIIQSLAASDPHNVQLQHSLGEGYCSLGELAWQQGNGPEAVKFFADALRIFKNLTIFDLGNASWPHRLSGAIVQLAVSAMAQLKLPQAYQYFADALFIRRRLAESDPSNVVHQVNLAVALDQLSVAAELQNKFPEAKRLLLNSLSVLQGLAESDPNDTDHQRHLALILERLGEATVAQGSLPEAQRYLTDSVRIRHRLAESGPGNAQLQRDLWVSHRKIAELLEPFDDEKARGHWRQAHDIVASMLNAGLDLPAQDGEAFEQLKAKISASGV
jgi:tetratricopeptide (TPR) repeat protein